MLRSGTRSTRLHHRPRAVAGLLACSVLVGVLAAASPAGGAGYDQADGSKVDVFDSQALITPVSTTRGATTIALVAARNEFESFQLKVTAGASALRGMAVALKSPFTRADGTQVPAGNVRVYREDYYRLTTMSDGELKAEFPRDAAGTCIGDCRIPDALIPERDVFTGEDRLAFPVDVPARENRVAWVDVLVPQTQAAGTYTATMSVTGTGMARDVVVTLEVLNAAIPSTTTMASQVFVNFNDIAVRRADGSVDTAATWEQYRKLAVLGLDNRMTIVPDGANPTQGKAILGPLLAGTAPNVRLPGARLTSLPITKYADAAAWHSVLSELGKTGLARMWCDETNAANPVSACTAAYDRALKSFPGLRLQQIPKMNQQPTTAGIVDPRVQTMVPLERTLDALGTSFTAWKAAAAGRQLYAYTSCMSAGCNAPYLDHALYVGTPSMGIDQPTSEARAMGWHGFRAGLDGEHYWTAAGAWSRSWTACSGVAPKNCQYTAAGEDTGMNGDGNLFYAPNAAKVGGTPIPVESLRLKRFRDGREDNELLHLVAARGKAADAKAIAAATFPRFDQSDRTPAVLATARAQLATLIRQLYPVAAVTPGAPQGVVAAAPTYVGGAGSMVSVQISWAAPTTGTAASYRVRHQQAWSSSCGATAGSRAWVDDGTTTARTLTRSTATDVSCSWTVWQVAAVSPTGAVGPWAAAAVTVPAILGRAYPYHLVRAVGGQARGGGTTSCGVATYQGCATNPVAGSRITAGTTVNVVEQR